MPRSLGGHHQSINAGLAVTLCASFEEDALQTGRATPGAQQRVSAAKGGQLPAAYQHGLLHTSWPGRSQVSFSRMIVCDHLQCLMLHMFSSQRDSGVLSPLQFGMNDHVW